GSSISANAMDEDDEIAIGFFAVGGDVNSSYIKYFHNVIASDSEAILFFGLHNCYIIKQISPCRIETLNQLLFSLPRSSFDLLFTSNSHGIGCKYFVIN